MSPLQTQESTLSKVEDAEKQVAQYINALYEVTKNYRETTDEYFLLTFMIRFNQKYLNMLQVLKSSISNGKKQSNTVFEQDLTKLISVKVNDINFGNDLVNGSNKFRHPGSKSINTKKKGAEILLVSSAILFTGCAAICFSTATNPILPG